MKRIIGIALVVTLAFGGLMGCAALTKDLNAVDGWITGTVVPDVCAGAKYYDEYIAGVVTAVETFPAVAAIIGPYVTLVNEGIQALDADCQSGALLGTINDDLGKVNGYITTINGLIGDAEAKGLMK